MNTPDTNYSIGMTGSLESASDNSVSNSGVSRRWEMPGNRFATAYRSSSPSQNHERLYVRLYEQTEVHSARWRNYHTEGVETHRVVETTLHCLTKRGHALNPSTEQEYHALEADALRCLRAVWKRYIWKAEQRHQSRLTRGLEAAYSLDGLLAAAGDAIALPPSGHARLYDPSDLLGGQTGRECLDYLRRGEGLSDGEAAAIVFYWAMESPSWRAAVEQANDAGYAVSEYQRKRLPSRAEAARDRLVSEEYMDEAGRRNLYRNCKKGTAYAVTTKGNSSNKFWY